MSYKLWLYNLVPLIFHIVLLPFWFMGKNSSSISLFEMVIGTIVIPIYLILINIRYSGEIKISNFMFLLIIMTGVIVLGHCIQYFNWGISSGKILTTDSETILIISFITKVSLGIVVVGWTIACLFKGNMR